MTSTSRRAVFYESARSMVPGPTGASTLSPDEVQIEVAFNGICGTDLHIFHGDVDHRVTRPAVIGHEMSASPPSAPASRGGTSGITSR